MSEPLQRIFYGQAHGPALYLAGDGYEDGGVRYAFRARSNPLQPAGPDGEAIFPALWLTVRHTMAVTLRVRSYLDGTLLDACVYDVALTAPTDGKRVTRTFEFGLFQCLCDSFDPTIQLGTVAPRGAALEVLVEALVPDGDELTPGLAAGDLILDMVSVEAEVVRDSRAAEAVA